MQPEPQGVAQVNSILKIKDELLAWADSMCSSSVHRSWEMAGREKEYAHELRLAESILSDVALRLRSAINPTCLPNKLPPEILTRCFLYLTPYISSTLGPHKSENDWIRVTHVCKYWRAVAFGTSGLWDRIEFTRPEVLNMHLKFSRSGPLEVSLQHVGHRFRQVASEPCDGMMFDLLVPVRSRIRSLMIHGDRILLHDRCQFMEGPLSELETLSITSNVGWEDGSEDRPQRRLKALFERGLPRLCQLFIAEYTPWPHNDFKNLRLLCLYNQSALELELPDLFRMLRGSPNLEELYIRQHETSIWIYTSPQNLGPTFPAHSLRKLRLHNFSNRAIAYILSTMLLQPNGVAVHLSGTLMTTVTLPGIFLLFPPELTLSSAKWLDIYHDSCGPFGLMFHGTGGSLRIDGYITGSDEYGGGTATSLLGYIYQECAQTLKDLRIHNLNSAGEGYIFDNFSCFSLEKFTLAGAGDVLDRLCTMLDPRNPGVRDSPAPRSRSLVIRGVYNQPQLERLIALCEGRCKTDHPLREISVAWDSRDIPEWVTKLCDSSPIPIQVDTRGEWGERELPMVCKESTGPWWPSWEGAFGDSRQHDNFVRISV